MTAFCVALFKKNKWEFTATTVLVTYKLPAKWNILNSFYWRIEYIGYIKTADKNIFVLVVSKLAHLVMNFSLSLHFSELHIFKYSKHLSTIRRKIQLYLNEESVASVAFFFKSGSLNEDDNGRDEEWSRDHFYGFHASLCRYVSCL